MTPQRLAILIPCYNVAKTIGSVLDSFPKTMMDRVERVFAIDNCSSDQTLAILHAYQRDLTKPWAPRLSVIENSQNYGLGGSQKIGFGLLSEQGFTHVMIVHGDGQGDGGKIADNFLKALDAEPSVDVVVASRFLVSGTTRGYSPLRVFANKLFNLLTGILTGCWMSDSGSGIELISLSFLRELQWHDLTNSFQFNPQLNILFYSKKTAKIREVPLEWKDSEAGTNIRALRYCWQLLMILVQYRVNHILQSAQSVPALNDHAHDVRFDYRVF